MGKVLRLPMNAPYAITEAITEFDDDPRSVRHPLPSESGLLAALDFVRDHVTRLSADADADDAQRKACLETLDTAFNTAMRMERTIINQTLHIEEMAKVASTDPLTGAHNRRGFEHELNRALAAAKRFHETGVLVYIDLDGFKPINDTYGHAAGDQVLIEVARTLQDHVRPQDQVARIGGDEFTVLLTRTSWEDGLKRAEYLKHLLNTLYVRWNGKNIAVRASLGFQRFGADADAASLLNKADSAMYEAKRLRGGGGGSGNRHADL